MHGDEQKWVDDATQTNWVSTVGANINEIEKQLAEFIGVEYAVALSAGMARFTWRRNSPPKGHTGRHGRTKDAPRT